jgi:hypothetical protein
LIFIHNKEVDIVLENRKKEIVKLNVNRR